MGMSGAEIRSSLVFENYTVNYVTFKTNSDFDAESVAINFELGSKVNTAQSRADVTLSLKLFPNAIENNYPFEMGLSVTGHFRVAEDEAGNAEGLFKINAISILFPYLRALVTTFTSNCNVPPLILPPINVHKVMAQPD